MTRVDLVSPCSSPTARRPYWFESPESSSSVSSPLPLRRQNAVDFDVDSDMAEEVDWESESFTLSGLDGDYPRSGLQFFSSLALESKRDVSSHVSSRPLRSLRDFGVFFAAGGGFSRPESDDFPAPFLTSLARFGVVDPLGLPVFNC